MRTHRSGDRARTHARSARRQAALATAVAQVLEPRQLLSAHLVNDFNPATGPSDPADYTICGGEMYFTAHDGQGQRQLWRTDGTDSGTTLLHTFAGSSAPSNFVATSGSLFFTASSGYGSPVSLWKSDGTVAGTMLVADLPDSATRFVPVGSTVMFIVHGHSNEQLWRSDGTAAGTGLVTAGGFSYLQRAWLGVGNILYFDAYDTVNRDRLWRSDGTAAGTYPLKTVMAGVYRHDMVAVGSDVYFPGSAPGFGWQLWRTDGTEAGTVPLTAGVLPGTSNPYNLFVQNNIVYFQVFNGDLGLSQLWQTDGTTAGTVAAGANLALGSGLAIQSPFPAGSSIFFTTVGDDGRGLWVTDGSESGTHRLSDIPPGNGYGADQFAVAGNRIFYTVVSSATTFDLWVSDGTADGTIDVAQLPVTEFSGGADLPTIAGFQDDVYFADTDPIHDIELWRSDGTAAGTGFFKDINAQSKGIELQAQAQLNGRLVLLVSINSQLELWSTDGSTGGTQLLADLPDGFSHPSSWANIAVVGNQVVFSIAADDGREQFWATDGTPTGTIQLAQLTTSSSWRDDCFTVAGTRLFFSGDDGIHGAELWSSDGTVAGTGMVKDINLGALTSDPWSITAIGDRVYFAATDPTSGRELWSSDGSEAGTKLIADINPGAADSTPYDFESLNGKIIFLATQASTGTEPWVTDGTAAGTALICDVNPGNNGTTGGQLMIAGGQAFFGWYQPLTGFELWATDGSTVGTHLIRDIVSGPDDSWPNPIGVLGDRLLFTAETAETGSELWVTDGTSGGTFMLADINPGPDGSGIQPLGSWNGRFYFSANDGIHGYEPWVTDGTVSGTHILCDINSGPGDSWPDAMTLFQNHLFFSADNGTGGAELWTTDGTDTGTRLVQDVYPGTSGSGPNSMLAVGDKLFFMATDPVYGPNLRAFTFPRVTSLAINDGAVQRSMVTSFTIAFSEPVILSDALQLTRRNGAAIPGVSLDVANPSGDGMTYIVTFSGTGIVGDSLPDGAYRLVISASGAQDLAGNPMTGDYVTKFHRLFGDANGDRNVTRADLVAARTVLRQPGGYVWWFDYGKDNSLDGSDLLQLRRRLRRSLL